MATDLVPVFRVRPRMQTSHLKRHELNFSWIFSGLVQHEQGSSTTAMVKGGVRGVLRAISAF